MNWTIVPILLPLATALLLIFLGRPSILRRVLVTVSSTAQIFLAVHLLSETLQGYTFVLPLGNWPTRIGIVLVVDPFSAMMVGLGALIALASILYGFAESAVAIENPLRLPLVQFLVVGINLTFCTGDLFNLFVGFEVMLISSYALLTLEADDWDIKQAYPYVAINLLGSTLFICAAGLAYGLFGTLGFADISLRARDLQDDPRLLALALLMLVVFGIKTGLFPLYYWLPNSYPTLPIPLAALFAGMLTKVGVYILIRFFGTVLPHDMPQLHQLLTWLAALTMLLPVLGALSRNFIRGILSFHILSQVGYIALAIGFFTPLSFTAAIFYIVHHIVVKASLFLIGGIASSLNRTDNLEKMGNLWTHAPWLGLIFLIQALSLAGIPPLSGFWGKYLVLLAGLRDGHYGYVAAAIVASILTLLSMLKIWNSAFWTNSASVPVDLDNRRWVGMTSVVVVLTLISLFIGFGAESVFRLSTVAADRVLDQDGYINQVFQPTGKGVLP